MSLQEAAAIGDVNLAKTIINKGIDVESFDNSLRDTALQRAVEADHVEIVELLLAEGADFNRKDGDGRTPLFLAIQNNNIDIVKLLLEAGALVNAMNDTGQTALIMAAGFMVAISSAKWRMVSGSVPQVEEAHSGVLGTPS